MDADVIVIGTFKNVERNRFSIIYHDNYTEPHGKDCVGKVDREFIYDVGELVVEDILKGRLLPNEKYVAFLSDYKESPANKKCSNLADMFPLDGLEFHEGQHGIWILRRNRVFLKDYLGATYFDAVVPLDSVEVVKEYIILNRYVDPSNVNTKRR